MKRAIQIGAVILILLFIGIPFAIGVLEFGLRLKNKFAGEVSVATAVGNTADSNFDAPIFVPHPYLLVYNKPLMNLPTVHTNAAGFRGQREYSKEKILGTKRVIVMGGSVAVGFNASDDNHTISAFLEKYLNDKISSSKFEVINAGCAGFNSHQDLILLATELLSWNPDLIVVVGGGTDINTSMHKDWAPHFHEMQFRFEDLFHHPWHEHSVAITFLRKLFVPPKMNVGKGVLHDQVAQTYLKNVFRMMSLASGAKIPMINVFQPALVLSTKSIHEDENNLLSKVLSRGGLPENYPELAKQLYPLVIEAAKHERFPSQSYFIDGSDIFAGQSFAAFSDAFHLTDSGYEFVAQFVGRFAIDKKLF